MLSFEVSTLIHFVEQAMRGIAPPPLILIKAHGLAPPRWLAPAALGEITRSTIPENASGRSRRSDA
jgi:hypothetical protein